MVEASRRCQTTQRPPRARNLTECLAVDANPCTALRSIRPQLFDLLRKIGSQRLPCRDTYGRQGMPVVVVIDPDAQIRPRPEGRDHGLGELETQEMYRGGLLLVLALQILIRNRKYLGVPLHLHPAAVLNALQLGE